MRKQLIIMLHIFISFAIFIITKIKKFEAKKNGGATEIW